MLRSMLACVVVVCLASVHAQPTACSEDSQCPDNLYCEDHMCRPCISCEQLRRQQPHQRTTCVRSIVECGPCLEGLVYDRRGDGGAGCVPPDDLPKTMDPSRSDENNGIPVFYVWIGVVSVLVLVLAGAMVYFMCRHPDIFKVKSWTNALVHASVSENGHVASVPTAPEHVASHTMTPYEIDPPPAYNMVHPDRIVTPHDETRPFLKPEDPLRPRDRREPLANQTARVFNNANYEPRQHGEENPPSPNAAYEIPTDHEQIDNMDERTMESPWTPGPDIGDSVPVPETATPAEQTDGAGAGASALLPRPAMPSDLTPLRKKPRLDNDDNNNSNEAGGSSEGEPSPRPHSGGGAPGHRPLLHLDLHFNQSINNFSVVQNASANKTTFSHNVT